MSERRTESVASALASLTVGALLSCNGNWLLAAREYGYRHIELLPIGRENIELVPFFGVVIGTEDEFLAVW